MKSKLKALPILALSLLFAAAIARAASVAGTVTNKTTGKPAAGDAVALVDVQAGMRDVASATTDGQGHYTLNLPGSGPYLIRAMHQGAGYFIAAPQGSGSGDISVYDVAAKVQGVSIEADVLEVEAGNGQLSVDERFFVHNTSSPPVTQWSKRSFEIVLPPDATVSDVDAQRPGGLATSIKLDSESQRGHYSFNFPIQPDSGDKDTLFQVTYTLPYSSGKYDFHSKLTLPAENFAVLMPTSMSLANGSGATLRSVQGDTGILTFLMKNAPADQEIAFTISGSGTLPRQSQSSSGSSQQSDNGSQQAAGTPGGGLGTPINTPDPLSKYKWWILVALALILVIAAAFLLRKPAGAEATTAGASLPAARAATTTASGGNMLLQALKDELFTLESDKISGKIDEEEYKHAKAALETVLKRALKRNS